MIRIRIVQGPHAGKSRDVMGGKFNGVEVDPGALLQQLFQLGSRWEIDFSRATEAELFEWGRADLVVRIVCALFEGRNVVFLGVVYKASSREEAVAVAGEVEDAIVNSGFNVTLERDDETGVIIGTHGTEYMMQ